MITDLITAQAYTKAIFALALRDQKLDVWQETLKALTLIATECVKRSLLNNPRVGAKKELVFFYNATKDFPQASNLVKMLAKRKKLDLLPKLADNYQQLLLEHNKILVAKVIAAYELTTKQQENLVSALQKRFGQQVILKYQIDSKLIGGAIIYVAGQVIDGSIKGMLQNLKQNLL